MLAWEGCVGERIDASRRKEVCGSMDVAVFAGVQECEFKGVLVFVR